jgi:type IV secretion system protein TrbI
MDTVPETTAPAPAEPLSVRARPRPVTRPNRPVLVGVGVVGVGLTMLVLARGLQAPPKPQRQAETPATGSRAALPDFLISGPKSYAERGIQQARAAPVPPPPPESPAPAPLATAAGGAPTPPTPGDAKTPPPRVKGAASASASPPRPPRRWIFAEFLGGGVQQPPFPVPQDDAKGREQGSSRRAESLFPQAVWGTPVDPTRVLYRSQVINGLLQHDVNSDQPGLIRILVTEAVQDRFGQGHTLLPQYSILLGSQDGTVKFGQSRLGVTIDSAELPDGTVVAFNKAKGADATGATGVSGSVNNHWTQVGIGAVLTAALSVGSRAAAGNPTGFQPNLAQDFARDVSQSINTTGQQIVRRSLEVAPTITIPHGTPVTIQLAENVSFQTPAARVRK